MIHADSLFSLGLVATFWALLRYARQKRLIWLVLAGLAAGGSTLTRSLLLPLLPLLSIWLLAIGWERMGWKWPSPPGPLSRRRRRGGEETPPSPVATGEGGWGDEGLLHLVQLFLPCALFVGLLALAITPWVWRNYQLYGGFIPSDTTGAIFTNARRD